MRLPSFISTFLKLFLVFWVIDLISSSNLFADEYFSNWFNFISALSSILFIISIFFIPNFVFPVIFEKQITVYQNTNELLGQSIENQNPLFFKIDLVFNQKKMFLNPDFSLSYLEKFLGVSGRYISDTIKRETGMNFSTYVNQARFDSLIEKCEDMSFFKGKNMDEIVGEVRFKSVNSFYKYFKKAKGCTPKEYLKNEVYRHPLSC